MLNQYLKFIEQLPSSRELKKEDLIHANFLIEKEKNLEKDLNKRLYSFRMH